MSTETPHDNGALDLSTTYDIIEKRGFSRATFLKAGGGLVIGLAFPSVAGAKVVTATAASASPLKKVPTLAPISEVNPGALSSWLWIAPDGTVTAFTGKVELGMGNQTSLSQIVAEELYVNVAKIKMVMGDTDICPDQGPTYGSLTISLAGPQLRSAAAAGYQTLLQMASTALGAPASSLSVSNGVVSDGSSSISYGDLVKGQVFTAAIPVTGTAPYYSLTAPTKPVANYEIVGKSIPRVDIPPKVAAEYEYVHDVRVPGMLHGRVVRPPAIGAQLVSVGKVPKGVKLVVIKNFVGVAAENEWDAIEAASKLKTKWTTWNGLPEQADLESYIYDTPSTTTVAFANPATKTVAQAQAAATSGMANAVKTVSGTYTTPIETHGSLGPSCALVDVQPNQVLVYSGTQGPNVVLTAVASALNVSPDIVHVRAYPASGCYGRNGSDPVTVDAALMSQALGAPVRVQWMRADEHVWDPKGPATIHQMSGGIDADGNVVAYQHEGWLAGSEGDVTIIGAALAGQVAFTTQASPGWSTNYFTYTFPNAAVISNQQNDLASDQNNGTGIISAWLRSPAQFQITYAHESFIDELAALAAADPIEFRLKYLTDQRFINVLQKVASLADWQTRPSPSGDANSKKRVVTGRGVGMALRDGTYAGNVAEVSVDRHTGKVTVNKIWGTQDCGLIVNPQAIKLGAEAGITQGTSRTMLEQVNFSTSAITSVDWYTYPILRFDQTPEVIFEAINNPSVPANGSGEPTMTPTAAAIGNAIFDATGVRMRDLPYRANYVKVQLKAAGKSV